MDKPRIAIMTWHTYLNYGSVLQASALYYKTQELGYSPALIYYYPKAGIIEQRKVTALGLLHSLKKKLRNLGNTGYASPERTRLFKEYLDEKTSKTNLCRSNAELWVLNDEFDAFVCGSDQIWSPLGCDEKYYLSFVDNPEKMIAYAPSLGVKKIENPLAQNVISHNLCRFKHLSVREEHGAKIIAELTGQKAQVVLDPTLLLSQEEWDKLADVPGADALPDEDYMLCYFLGDSRKYIKYVRKLASAKGLPFYLIPIMQKQKAMREAVPFEVGPKEFVSLIRRAKYVCTDSFHGAVFSVNYNIPFCVFPRFREKDPQNQNARVEHLLKLLGLEECYVQPQNYDFSEKAPIIDYTEVNARLATQRKMSLAYLENALTEAVCAKKTADVPYKITDTCCGCGACTTICPHKAIQIINNESGFQHYQIDEDKCVSCGICRTVCPMAKVTAMEMKDAVGLYSARSVSESVLRKSSSGGIAHELAQLFQQEGRFVCGCVYDSTDNSAKHIILNPDDKERIALLQGSKYIQSRTTEAIENIAELAANSPISFFGTPCQVAAVDKLLRRKNLRNRAVLVDLICHGVPTYNLWKRHLSSIQKYYHTGENPAVTFRFNKNNWHKRQMRVEGNGQLYQKNEREDDFYAFFRRRLCDMDACYECPYRERTSADLRIGDYWGKRFAHEKNGISMVIATTQNGQDALIKLEKRGSIHAQKQSLQEYWTVQYPYNTAKPLYHGQLIAALRDNNIDLHTLRKDYCKYFDFLEKTAKAKLIIKRLLKRG